MAFDQSTRNFLQRTVTKCREILAGRWQAPTEGEFFRQLQEIYGISPDGVAAPMEVLAHLSDEDRETACVLRDTLDHYVASFKASGKSEKDARRDSVMRLAREQAFTVLNRLAALRMAEERGIVLECVRKGAQSEGFQLFLQSAGSAFGSTSSAYRAYLHLLFDELARDLGVLFNRFDKGSLIFPRHEALESLLKELNGTGEANRDASFAPEQVASLWGEDETVGWIYQYYNDPSERKKMREESSAPRNSRELAVRNQFFTPRYVVEFLTDNTLGRIWYEMTQGDTTLKEQCRYLVRRPTEIFLQPNETAPQQPKQDNLSQEDLLKQPVFILHRPLKDPRTILMLDPACGSMHFGLYAFDLFEVIYDEAWALEEKLGEDALSRPPGMKSLHDTYAGKDAFVKDVPRLIIENNIHGIDIDPRAAQIAGLSLWLRAQRAWQRLGLKPAERPAIKRSNIVCAEPMPGEKELLREFVEREFPAAERAVCLQLLEAIFDKMQLAGEAGSLLKIEGEIRSAIEDARDAWQKLATKPPELFTTTELNQLSTAPELTGLEQAVSSLIPDPRPLTTDFWERIEERIYAALRDYAEQAENGGGFQRRLFAEDAARGFAFIDVCRKRYDVVLMNPPFGDLSVNIVAYVRERFLVENQEFYSCFITNASEQITSRGRLGVICGRPAFFAEGLDRWREKTLQNFYSVGFLDLGGGVLDAMVETCASCWEKRVPLQADNRVLSDFIRLNDSSDKATTLDEALSSPFDARRFLRDATFVELIPRRTFAYWLPTVFVSWFSMNLSLEDAGLKVFIGVQTDDDFRFCRLHWEVQRSNLIRAHRSENLSSQGDDDLNSTFQEKSHASTWATLLKGGEAFPFFADFPLVLNWHNRGEELKEATADAPGGRVNNETQFFKSGFSWSIRTDFFSPHIVPPGTIPTVSRYLAKSKSSESDRALVAALNSSLYEVLVRTRMGKWTQPLYMAGVIEGLPDLPGIHEDETLETLTQTVATEILRDIGEDETSNYFRYLPLGKRTPQRFVDFSEVIESSFVKAGTVSRQDILFSRQEVTAFNQGKKKLELPTINDLENAKPLISFLLGVSFGRWDIRYATSEQAAPELPDPFAPLPVCPPGQLQNAQGLPARPEDVPTAYPVRIPWDGILVDDPNHSLDIERRVREVIEIIWSGKEGGPTAEAIEHEACEILGVKSLRDYFRKPAGFFADHLKRYSKSRRQAPIYWPLATSSGSYTLWIYYHRLTPDTLYKCLQQFVEPKIKDVDQEIHRLRTMLTADEAGTKERKQLADAETLVNELKELQAELSFWAPKWKPNLNDGALITVSPLWKLFRLPKWRKDLEACWKELEAGDYDWAHLAYTLFPARVREKCKTDRSIAIAHGLEDLCQVQAPAPKAKRAKKQKKLPTEEDGLL